jgi:hypothetical protein
MPFCMLFGQAVSGEIFLNVSQNGSRYTGISADGKNKIFC